MPTPNIKDSAKAYESWLRRQIAGEIVAKDLARKHEKMAQSPFAFLRATYWRWSETIFEVCPTLSSAPKVLAVGDVHLENFGTWRDIDGRLVWGVNDFDEAADMPYALDLVRLAASANLARGGDDTAVSHNILEGYRAGLRRPDPFVLDRDHPWLRELVTVSESQREAFWEKLDAKSKGRAKPPPRYRRRLLAAMPEPNGKIAFAKRTAGVGSLGRPRWLALARYRGGPVIREAKVLVPSAWTLFHGPRRAKTRCGDIAGGKFCSPDPWYSVADGILVRRLSPNNRKIEIDAEPSALLSPRMLGAMGFELANIHLGSANARAAIERDLTKRTGDWLHTAAKDAARAVTADYKDWKRT